MKSKKNEHSIIKEASVYSFSKYFAEIFLALKGFIIATFLGPSLYGLWSFIKTIIFSAKYFSFGTSDAMLRQIPLNKGKKEFDKNYKIKQTSLTFRLLVSFIVCFIIIILSFTNKINEYKIETQLLGIVFIFQSIYYYSLDKFRSETKIIQLSKMEFFYALLTTILGISLLLISKVQGLLLSLIITHTILFFYLWKNKDLLFDFMIEFKLLKKLFRIGFPITVLILCIYLMQNMDKILIYIFLGNTMTGYYGLASFLLNIINYIPLTLSTVLFPRMMYKFGKTNNRNEIEEYFHRPMELVSGIMPLILGLLFINIDLAITFFLPEYIPSINTIRILIIGLYFYSILSIPINILIAFNKQKQFMYISIIILIIQVVLQFLAIKLGYNIIGVAIVTGFIFFLSSFLAIIYTLFLFRKSAVKIMKTLGEISLPFFYQIVILAVLYLVNIPLNNLILKNLVLSVLFIILMMPLLVYVNSRSNILKKIIPVFKPKK